jgi:hypothetical protein
MKRLILAVLVLLAVVAGARAQSYTTVTATVTDNSTAATPYILGSYTVTLLNNTGQQALFGGSANFQQNFSGQTLSAAGVLSIVLPSVSVMTPGGLQWQFRVCANPGQIANVFPLPALPCFTYTSTGTQVSGTSVDLSSSMKAVAATIPLATGSGGSTFPAGQTPAVNAIFAADPKYGLKDDGFTAPDVTTTNASGRIQCLASDCNLTAAIVGKTCFVSPSSGTNGTSLQPNIGQGTITLFTNGNDFTCSATSSGSLAGTGILMVGTIDTTALLAAHADAMAQNRALHLPSGYMLFDTCLFIDNRPTSHVPYSLEGEQTTTLVAVPNLTFTGLGGCPNGIVFDDLNLGTNSVPNYDMIRDFNVWGLGLCPQNSAGTRSILHLVRVVLDNVGLIGWGACGGNGANLSGAFVSGPVEFTKLLVDWAGSTACFFSSNGGNQTITTALGWCIGGAVAGGNMIGTAVGAQVYSWGNFYGPEGASGRCLQLAGTFISVGDIWNCLNSFSVRVGDGGTGVFTCIGSQIYGATSAQNGLIYIFNTGTFISGPSCQISASGGGGAAAVSGASSSGIFMDAAPNTTIVGAINTISVEGDASAIGVPITAAKLVLSAGWGTTAAWTSLSGFTKKVRGTITASGTGQAATPTITYTYPTPFLQTVVPVCEIKQDGGTQTAVANPFTVGTPTNTSVVFTYTGTPGAGNTLIAVIDCGNP